jgi:hypothetical protein
VRTTRSFSLTPYFFGISSLSLFSNPGAAI